jgi:hypothetical protein
LASAVKQGDPAALAEMHRLARSAATVAAKAVYLKALEQLAAAGVLTPGPQWRGQDAAISAGTIIRPGQFQFKPGAAIAPGATTGPAISPPTVQPAPAPGPVVDAGGAPAPYFPPTPSPISPAAGGGPTASETVAAAANGEGGGVETMQAGMMGGIDLKNPMVMLTLAGLGLFVVSQFAGKGTSRRSRR